jgi:hypothetical protein
MVSSTPTDRPTCRNTDFGQTDTSSPPNWGNVTCEANIRPTVASSLRALDLGISLTVTIVGRGPGIAIAYGDQCRGIHREQRRRLRPSGRSHL